MDSIQSPMHDSKSTDDYSDIASDDAEGRPKDRRRYVRGGRKAGRRDSSRDELELLEGHQDSDARPVAPDACPYCAGKPQPPSPRPSPEQSAAAAPFDTGIRAFNIRRAAGGRRPVSVRAPPARRKPSAKRRGKQRTRPDDDEAAGAAADDDDGVGETEARDGGSRASTEGSASEAPRNAGAGKPMSIRLDLNLMVEVFLKAKIQGDVTITFLYGMKPLGRSAWLSLALASTRWGRAAAEDRSGRWVGTGGMMPPRNSNQPRREREDGNVWPCRRL
ncbi:hypothetical protein JHW43_001281 [Diplocarpon mali]|nr:hypothetical protein JHW43_001281 [Diplocarpon mali]